MEQNQWDFKNIAYDNIPSLDLQALQVCIMCKRTKYQEAWRRTCYNSLLDSKYKEEILRPNCAN